PRVRRLILPQDRWECVFSSCILVYQRFGRPSNSSLGVLVRILWLGVRWEAVIKPPENVCCGVFPHLKVSGVVQGLCLLISPLVGPCRGVFGRICSDSSQNDE